MNYHSLFRIALQAIEKAMLFVGKGHEIRLIAILIRAEKDPGIEAKVLTRSASPLFITFT